MPSTVIYAGLSALTAVLLAHQVFHLGQPSPPATTPGPKKAWLAFGASAGLVLAARACVHFLPSLALLLTWAACSLSLVGVAFSGRGLHIFRRKSGYLSLTSYFLLLPYLLPTWAFHAWRRSQSGPATEIASNVFLGGYPWGRGPWHAVLDMTCEYPTPSAPAGAAYLNIPCVDGVHVPPEALKAGSGFIEQHWRHGPVLIHCAIGRYRSARAVAQWLQDYQGMTEQDAWRLLKDKRPLVRPPKHLSI